MVVSSYNLWWRNQNEKISISKKLLKALIEKENFLSNIITLNVRWKSSKCSS